MEVEEADEVGMDEEDQGKYQENGMATSFNEAILGETSGEAIELTLHWIGCMTQWLARYVDSPPNVEMEDGEESYQIDKLPPSLVTTSINHP